MSYAQPKEVKIKEKQDKFLRQQLEKEREQQLLEEIEKTEKERVKKKGESNSSNLLLSRSESVKAERHSKQLLILADISVQVRTSNGRFIRVFCADRFEIREKGEGATQKRSGRAHEATK